MLSLKNGEQWGVRLIVRLPCAHEVEILREWVDEDGRFIGRLSCTDCRRTFEDVVLQGWESAKSRR